MIYLQPATVATPPGTRVLVVRDCGQSPCITETRSEPWALGHGQMVVALKGKSGGYSLDRVFLLPK